MTDPQMIQLRAEVNAVIAQMKVLDQNLAAAQGVIRALEMIVNCLVLTQPNPKAVKQAIAENAPNLLEGFSESHIAGQTMRQILANVEGTIAGEVARRAAKSAEQGA